MRAALLIVLGGCALSGVKGSGTPGQSVRQVAAFDAIEVSGTLDADITPGPLHVEVSGDDNLVPLVETEVHGQTLVLRQTKSMRPRLALRVAIQAPSFRRVEGLRRGRRNLIHVAGDDLRLDLSGAGNLVADGSVHHLTVDVSGAGTIYATALTAERVDASISGAGTADVFASQSLSAHVSGAGTDPSPATRRRSRRTSPARARLSRARQNRSAIRSAPLCAKRERGPARARRSENRSGAYSRTREHRKRSCNEAPAGRSRAFASGAATKRRGRSRAFARPRARGRRARRTPSAPRRPCGRAS